MAFLVGRRSANQAQRVRDLSLHQARPSTHKIDTAQTHAQISASLTVSGPFSRSFGLAQPHVGLLRLLQHMLERVRATAVSACKALRLVHASQRTPYHALASGRAAVM